MINAISNKISTGAPAAAAFNTKSILLNGSSEFINIDAVQSALSSATLGVFSWWAKPVDATPAAAASMVSFGRTGGNERMMFYIDGAGRFNALIVKTGTTRWHLRTDAAAFSDNTWAHCAVVQDGSPELWIDGAVPAQTFVNSTGVADWLNDLTAVDNGRIGSLNFNSAGESNHFNGNIDEVILTNTAAADPNDIYNSGSPKDESSISGGVSYFRFDGDTLPTITDNIGSNNGTATGGTLENDTP